MNSPSKNTVFWMLCIMGLFAILSSTMSKSPVLKLFASALNAPTEWTGFIASASTIPGILVSLPAASLSDMLGRRKMLLVAGFVFASAPFLYLLVTAWWQLIFVRFYHGFATAIFVPVAEASVAEQFPLKRGERIGLFSSVTAVGRATAPFLGGAILSVTNYGFQTLYLVVAIAGVTALVTGVLFVAERKNPSHEAKDAEPRTTSKMIRRWAATFMNRGALAVSVIQASQYYAYGAVEFYLVGFLNDVAQIDPALIGIVMGSLVVAIILVRPLMGRVSDRIGRRIPIVVGCIVSSLPLLAIPFVNLFPILLLLSVVYGIGFAAVIACTSALMCEVVSQEYTGTSMGFLDMTMDVGQTLGPIVCGWILASSLQYVGVFYSLTLVLLVSCSIFAFSGVAKKSTKI